MEEEILGNVAIDSKHWCETSTYAEVDISSQVCILREFTESEDCGGHSEQG